jgi:hypothetical protein
VTPFPYGPPPGFGPGRIVLRTYSAARRVLVIVLGLVALIPCSALLVAAYDISWFIAVIPISALSMLVYTTVRVFRYAVLLQGTALVERGAFASRRCDLTSAMVTLGAYPVNVPVPLAGGRVMQVQSSRVTPALTAFDGRTAVRLNLQPPLAPWKLIAVADAVVAGGQRQDPAAWQVATTLRQWASLPPAGRRR